MSEEQDRIYWKGWRIWLTCFTVVWTFGANNSVRCGRHINYTGLTRCRRRTLIEIFNAYVVDVTGWCDHLMTATGCRWTIIGRRWKRERIMMMMIVVGHIRLCSHVIIWPGSMGRHINRSRCSRRRCCLEQALSRWPYVRLALRCDGHLFVNLFDDLIGDAHTGKFWRCQTGGAVRTGQTNLLRYCAKKKMRTIYYY